MIKKKILFIFILFFISSFSSAKIENNIILKVENEIITNYDIKNKILRTLILSGQEINQKNINFLKEQSLNDLIFQKLKKIELERFNFKDDKTQINNYLRTISSNNIDLLKEKFKQSDTDFDLYLDEIEINFKWQKFIYKFYSNKIELDENSIQLELKKIIENKSDLEEFRISEIEISDYNKSESEKIITNIKRQIEENGFENTALKISNSSTASKKGDLGWINGKSLSEQIYKILNKMKIGDISNPIKRQDSILFLKLNDKRVSKVDDIDIKKLKNRIINQKKNELFNLYSRSHLSKLKNTSFIDYK